MSSKKPITLILGGSSDLAVALISSMGSDETVLAQYQSKSDQLASLQKNRPNLFLYQCDLTKNDDLEALLEVISSKHGCPNRIIQFAAPKFRHIRVSQVSWSDLVNEIDVSLKSIFQVFKHFSPKMIERKQGKILIMLSSVTLASPPKNLVHYNTAKFALLGFVKSMAVEYADKNIQINAISPSMIETKFLSEINPRIIELNAEGLPLKRNASVKDVIPLILFLLSDEANYMTGLNIPITGGSVM